MSTKTIYLKMHSLKMHSLAKVRGERRDEPVLGFGVGPAEHAGRLKPQFGHSQRIVRYSARSIEQHDVDHAIRHCSNGASGSERRNEGQHDVAAKAYTQGFVLVKLECHGMTGSWSPSVEKNTVIGHEARPYEVSFGVKPVGASAVKTRDDPSAPIAAVALR